MTTNNKGFTILELAIVLLIISLLIGILLNPLTQIIENSNRNETAELLQTVQKNLLSYTIINGRMPCPDCRASDPNNNCPGLDDEMKDDGLEDHNNERCRTEFGNLPWQTLSAPARDAWGNNLLYQVTQRFARCVDANSDDEDECDNLNPVFDLTDIDNGNINVYKALPINNTNRIAQNIPALIFSSGRNGRQDESEYEAENQNGDDHFVSAGYIRRTSTTEADTAFDDLVLWISPYVLMYEMVNAERLP